jgi:hypothetical protein
VHRRGLYRSALAAINPLVSEFHWEFSFTNGIEADFSDGLPIILHAADFPFLLSTPQRQNNM